MCQSRDDHLWGRFETSELPVYCAKSSVAAQNQSDCTKATEKPEKYRFHCNFRVFEPITMFLSHFCSELLRISFR